MTTPHRPVEWLATPAPPLELARRPHPADTGVQPERNEMGPVRRVSIRASRAPHPEQRRRGSARRTWTNPSSARGRQRCGPGGSRPTTRPSTTRTAQPGAGPACAGDRQLRLQTRVCIAFGHESLCDARTDGCRAKNSEALNEVKGSARQIAKRLKAGGSRWAGRRRDGCYDGNSSACGNGPRTGRFGTGRAGTRSSST